MKDITNAQTTVIMKSFIEDYLDNPAQAIADARLSTDAWYDNIDEDMIYSQIASPEFRLYEAMIISPDQDEQAYSTVYVS